MTLREASTSRSWPSGSNRLKCLSCSSKWARSSVRDTCSAIPFHLKIPCSFPGAGRSEQGRAETLHPPFPPLDLVGPQEPGDGLGLGNASLPHPLERLGYGKRKHLEEFVI